QQSIAERKPIYLFDRGLSDSEIFDRNLKCTFNVILQGAGLLTDNHLAGREIIGFGHSTGGPMAAHLTRFSKKTKVIGLVGFGSGGPDGWRKEWRDKTGAEKYVEKPIDHVSKRSPDSFNASGYVDPEDLTPWGGADDYIRLVSPLRSQMKTSLCDNQHNAAVGILEEYPKAHRAPARGVFRSSAGSRSELVENDPRSLSRRRERQGALGQQWRAVRKQARNVHGRKICRYHAGGSCRLDPALRPRRLCGTLQREDRLSLALGIQGWLLRPIKSTD